MVGAVLAVTKTVATNVLLQGNESNLHPIELLTILSPFAAAQALLFSVWSGEFSLIMRNAPESKWLALVVLINSAMAAALNIFSFEANRRSGPLAMAIIANLKQVLLLAMPLGGKLPGPAVVCGTALTVVGSMWYARVQSRDKRDHQSNATRILPQHHGDRT